MIVESYHVVGTTGDILAAPSRLAAIPYNGNLILEFQATVNDTSNYMRVTVQTPDGATPVEDVRIPAGATAGGMNADDKYTLMFPVSQGGHVLVQLTETGTAICNVRATLSP